MTNKEIDKLKLKTNKILLSSTIKTLNGEQKLLIKEMLEHFKKDKWDLSLTMYQSLLMIPMDALVLLLNKHKMEPYFNKKITRLMIRKIK